MTLALIIPIKELSEGKSRLDSVLEPGMRSRLNRFLASRTLGIAREMRKICTVFVVSKSDEVLSLARSHSFASLREPKSVSLNDALYYATSAAMQRGCSKLLVVPVDLVFLSVALLSEIIERSRGTDVTLVTDAAESGTNAVFWNDIKQARFLFGSDSATHHALSAIQRGLTVKTIKDSALSFDLDHPEDLERWDASCSENERIGWRTGGAMPSSLQC